MVNFFDNNAPDDDADSAHQTLEAMMPRPQAAHLTPPAHLAAFILIGVFCRVSMAQDFSDYELVDAEEEIASNLAPSSYEETVLGLEKRLRRAEADLQSLYSVQAAEEAEKAQASMADALAERWAQVRDPSIITVDQQTRQTTPKKEAEKAKKWYDRLSIRGYAQFRFNTILDHEDGSAAAQIVGDGSVGENRSFFIRRARVIISGDVSDHMYVYLQPDFASNIPGSPDANQFAQIRDWYGDLYIDKEKVYRVRIGQSKIPYGWENLQSSSNRLPLDRNDALNSAVRNERDLGMMFYWTPTESQDIFKKVLDEGLKGSGNYGVFGIGIYNGQGGSFTEQNDDLHAVARLAYPFYVDDEQIVELGIQGYTGRYVVLSSPIRPLGVGTAIRPLGTLETNGVAGIMDERVAGTFVWYPQPFGFQAEWTVGNGPALNNAQTAVIERSLYGGYAMVNYRYVTESWGTLFPFIRWSYFKGGYKTERNAPYSLIDEGEVGLEWQFNPQMELVAQYTFTDRTNTTALASGRSYGQFDGHLLRFQFQVNY
jgi:Phosphate-selective porin O and P